MVGRRVMVANLSGGKPASTRRCGQCRGQFVRAFARLCGVRRRCRKCSSSQPPLCRRSNRISAEPSLGRSFLRNVGGVSDALRRAKKTPLRPDEYLITYYTVRLPITAP